MSSGYVLESVVAPYIAGLVAEKRALGFKYADAERELARFDRYCAERSLRDPAFTREFLEDWCRRRPTEGQSYRDKRVSVVRQLVKYMASVGVCAYLPQLRSSRSVTLPHILTDEERMAFFESVDSYEPVAGTPANLRLAGEWKVLFRMIYSCGLRNSEACGIASDKVDLEGGVLEIADSKGRKSRLVYMPDDLRALCSDYFAWLSRALDGAPPWFFPARDPGKPLVNTTVCRAFNRFWARTRFSAACSNKPTTHDLRFSFVTDRVNAWALEGVDLGAMVPYLSRYLGHRDIEETYYYFHTSKQLHDVIAMYDSTSGTAIPEVTPYEIG